MEQRTQKNRTQVTNEHDSLRREFLRHLQLSLGTTLAQATRQEQLAAICLVVRDRLAQRQIKTEQAYAEAKVKRAYYLSAEFLLGRALENNLIHLGIRADVEQLLDELNPGRSITLGDLLEEEPDAGLGNGGLGRLAACFMESTASLGVPAIGYGIRYEFGIFEQVIQDGYQQERPETWARHGTPWEYPRPSESVEVFFGGSSRAFVHRDGEIRWQWVPDEVVQGIPHDRPIAGFRIGNVNRLRLWQARALEDLDLAAFNRGDYEGAARKKTRAETISKVLYPNDASEAGRELRLRQEYFFTRCSLADIVRRHLGSELPLKRLPEQAAIQLNDTHPAIAVAELMRILLDEHHLPWEEAWNITRGTISFTNHTVMSEALERWPVSMMGRVLPRHLELIYEINRRFLAEVEARWPKEPSRLARMSIIEEGAHEKRVRMANLAIVGSHAVNGVAELHTELLRKEVFRDFFEMNPERFHNVTNGVTPVRWLIECNPRLSAAISRRIGHAWMRDLDELEKLSAFATDSGFQREILAIKRANKAELAAYFASSLDLTIDPDSLIDVQIKRIHEYKRQLMNVLHVIVLYQRLRRDPKATQIPRTFLIGGKAASAYETAKQIIKLATSVAARIAAEPACQGKLALHFVPNYRVSLAERMIPAADLSEQISTAGTEASGTSNMKLALNGALTIGTLDGANIEIRDAVGPENFFLFGLDIAGIQRTHREPYRPSTLIGRLPELEEALALIDSGHFSPEERHRFESLTGDIRNHDPYRIAADFASYTEMHQEAERVYRQPERWAEMVIRNISAMGRFSSNRSIRDYARDIWKVKALTLPQ